MSERIVIIDGNSLINRAYYAMQRPMITKEGVYTQAIYGFLNMLGKIQTDHEPDYLAVAWDLKAPTFRHKEYEDYKAGRKKMPMELAMQLPITKEILEAMNIKNLSLEGYEADDIIGTLAKESEKEGLEVLVITGDKDALQLVSEHTHVLITRKGISEFDLYDIKAMEERYGLTPSQFIDLKGLMGDQSDNIPGIPGVGEKTGINLLKQFGSLENILNNTEEISGKALKEKVESNKNLAVMSRRLAEIITDIPLETKPKDLKVEDPDYHKLIDIYSRLEFNSFLKKLKASGIEESEDVEGASAKDYFELKRGEVIVEEKRVEEILSKAKHVYIKVFSNDDHIFLPAITGMAISLDDVCHYITGEKPIKIAIQIFNKSKVKFSGHDLVKDYYALMMNGLEVQETAFDTAISSYVLDPSKSGYNLKALTMENFHKTIRDEKEFFANLKQESLLDNNNDDYLDYGVEWLSAVKNLETEFVEAVNKNNLNNVLYDVELPLISVLASMEKEGIRVDNKTLDNFGKELKSEIDDITSEIYGLAECEFNINSPKQLGEVLFEKLGLTPGKKTKSGYSTNAETLEKIAEEHEIVPLILRYRTLAKLNSTYVEGLIPLIGSDQKIRAHFQQTVTATGRISCTEPNLQNIPIRNEYGRQLRRAFLPSDENHVLVGADYSQIELRVLAHMAGDESLIEAFNNGDDIHRATASRVFDIPYDEVTSIDRSRAKAVNFGVIYGMSGFGLSEELGISRWDAERYIEDYFEKHPKVKAFMDEQIAKCKELGYTETIMGRRRYIPEIKSSNYMVRSLGERLAMNSPIQGSAADIIKIAMIKVAQDLENKGLASKLILQVHDELIIDTLKSEKESVEKLLVDNMMNAVKLKVELVSDLNWGDSWLDLK